MKLLRLPSKYSTALLCAAVFLAACGAKQQNAGSQANHDATGDAWYATASKELTDLDRRAEQLYREGKADAASTLIEQGETVAARLLAVPRPTLAATEAAADLDDLYGRMLFANRHYGWARLQFQKNLARWKRWQPESPDSLARLKRAQTAIDECDKKIESGS